MADNGSDAGAFLSGLMIGGLIGAGVALLYAPQSGEATRQQIAEKSTELKTQAETELAKIQEQAQATLTDLQSKANQVTADAQQQIDKARAQLEGTVNNIKPKNNA